VNEPFVPSVHFTDNGDGTVTVRDNIGQTTWLADASCTDPAGGVDPAGGLLSWPEAIVWSAGLADGACGLLDGSAAGDWQLPTHVQLMHLHEDLAAGSPFTGVQPAAYWSSWTYWTDRAGAVDMYSGEYLEEPKTLSLNVWPVRLAP
jgi:hypothetical protein